MQVHHETLEISSLQNKMLRIRMIEEAIADRYHEQKMRCPVHLSIGQEAVAVGVCHHLKKSDYAVSGHRAHAHYLAKGGDLKKMIAEIYGKETGCCKGRGGSMHLVDLDVGFLGSTPIVGGSIPIGVGAAFGSFLKNEGRVTVIFLGEGATEEGVFVESLNFSALKRLPVLYVCENNLYSVYSPLNVRQPKERKITELARAHGIPAFSHEGNNIQEVAMQTENALQYVRQGKGPFLLEFYTYRFREHCGPNLDPHQPKDEYIFWENKDPLSDIVGEKDLILREIEEAFLFAENSPYPSQHQCDT